MTASLGEVAKYWHKINGKWVALTREESNKVLGIKNETHKKKQEVSTVRPHAGVTTESSKSRGSTDANGNHAV